ncbi:MAG: ankyrin repeat domain-containing protein [bacterium]
MKKLFLVFIAVVVLSSPSFAQSSFQSYEKPISNTAIGNTVLEFEDNNIKITSNKYEPGFGMIQDKKAAIYEYLITNKTGKPIILKEMTAPDRINKVTTSTLMFYNSPNDLLINAVSFAYLEGKVIALDKLFQPFPSNYLIGAKDTTRVLFLSKIYINPLVAFQFLVNDHLKTIKSSAANIVKDDKYYQSLVDYQHAKYKDIDIVNCVQNNDVDLVEAYMKTGMNPNDTYGFNSLLGMAIKANNLRMVDVLLKAGANPNQQDWGPYFLTLAIKNKQSEIAEMLIEAGANPNQKSVGTYPLIWAIINKQSEIAELLINKGADPNVIYWGKTALTYAIKTKQAEIVECLINSGAKIDEKSVKYAEKSQDNYIKNLVLLNIKSP